MTYWQRSDAHLPNKTWQATLTHWAIDDGTAEGKKMEVVGLFAAMTVDVATSTKGHALTWPDIVVIMLVTLPLAGRRRAPLGYAGVVVVLAIVLVGPFGQSNTNVLPVYAVLVPAYTVAAYEERGRARWGLLICLPGLTILSLLGPGGIAT